MNFKSLRQNLIDVVEEGQIKLGYREETLRMYYPLDSLNAFLGEKLTAEEMEKALSEFAGQERSEFGALEISCRKGRFCISIPAEGVRWIWENTPKGGFLSEFIRTIEKHGCTLEDLLKVFRKASDKVCIEELHNGEFDYLVYFEDGVPDAFRYCLTDEGCHFTYHRFTKPDYEAFGF